MYRASGLALLLGLALLIIGAALSFAFQFLSPLWWVATLAWNSGDLLLLLGLPGIFVRQAPRAGWLGFVGFLLTFISVFLTASFLWVSYLLIGPWLYQVAPKLDPQGLFISTLVAGILFALGGILLGIAIMRAGILPRWSGLLLLIGAVLSIVSFALNAIIRNIVLIGNIVSILAFVLVAVALGWIGFALMSTRSVEAAQPAPASKEETTDSGQQQAGSAFLPLARACHRAVALRLCQMDDPPGSLAGPHFLAPFPPHTAPAARDTAYASGYRAGVGS